MISDRKTAGCHRVVENCSLETAGLRLATNLIVFHLMEFDIILGIDCCKKKIVFDMPIKEKFCYIGEIISSIPSIVSTK